MSDDYWALGVSLEADGLEAREAVANFLWESGAIGVVEDGDGRSDELRAFFPPGPDPNDVRSRLDAFLADLRALTVAVGAGVVDIRRLPTEAWADAWRAHFRPIPVGRQLLVCPPWAEPAPPHEPAAARVRILIEPGRAFGTGGHATTRGCLELLERALAAVPAARVLDVGTGSGVLAIAAARLGAGEVYALDVDPDAVAAARGNAARNAVADRVRVELGALETWPGPPADLVLANLLGAAHVSLAGRLAGQVAPRGRLIAGGLQIHEVPVVVATFVREGLWLVELVEHEGWATLALGRST